MNVALGRYFESQAAKYLKNLGHEVVVRNFYSPYGEIDIISIFNNKIRFIEVKFLSRLGKISPVEKINTSKLRKIFFSIAYLKKFSKIKNYQVDSVGMYFKNNKLIIEYLEDLRL
jgi:putative endonuclease